MSQPHANSRAASLRQNPRAQDVNVTKGVKAALADLDGITDAVANKGLSKGINKALSVVVRQAKANLTKLKIKRTGMLRKSISKKVKKYRSGVVVGLAGTDANVIAKVGGKTVWPNKYLHLVEQGTAPHSQPKRGAKGMNHPGSKAKAFLKPAAAQTREQVISIIAQAVQEEINKARAKGN